MVVDCFHWFVLLLILSTYYSEEVPSLHVFYVKVRFFFFSKKLFIICKKKSLQMSRSGSSYAHHSTTFITFLVKRKTQSGKTETQEDTQIEFQCNKYIREKCAHRCTVVGNQVVLAKFFEEERGTWGCQKILGGSPFSSFIAFL